MRSPIEGNAILPPKSSLLSLCHTNRHRQNNAIFSYEKSSQGKRTYIVSTREAFWAFYIAQDAHSRHHYEVIRADRPCRLYFDLEFSRTLNPHANGPRMRRTLVREVCRELGMVFGLSGRVRVRFIRHNLCPTSWSNILALNSGTVVGSKNGLKHSNKIF